MFVQDIVIYPTYQWLQALEMLSVATSLEINFSNRHKANIQGKCSADGVSGCLTVLRISLK